MKVTNVFMYLVLVTIIAQTIIYTGCEQTDPNKPDPVVAIYGGSDPSGHFIEVKIDRTNSTVTKIDHSTSETFGPYPFGIDQGYKNTTGISIVYNAIIDPSATEGQPKYVRFVEFKDTALLFVLFDVNEKPLGNPNYAVIKEKVDKSTFYDKAYNWMRFIVDDESVDDESVDHDMNTGFAAFDNASGEGLLYGAAYSQRAEHEKWAGYTNGINDINEGDFVKVDSFLYDPLSHSTYFYADSDIWDNRVSFAGNENGTNIVNFGADQGGGSGLFIPQNYGIKEWNADWNGVYYSVLYNYTTDSTNSVTNSSIQPIKIKIYSESDNFFVEGYDDNESTQTATPLFGPLMIIPTNDLSSDNSPGGIAKIVTQFATISNNNTASSNIVKSANNCYGSFVLPEESGITTIIMDPDGRFAGFTGFTIQENSVDYRFGFCIKDENYVDPTPQ